MKTYSEVAKERERKKKKSMGAKAYNQARSELGKMASKKRWKKCECGHPYNSHDGACCSDSCTCRVFRATQ